MGECTIKPTVLPIFGDRQYIVHVTGNETPLQEPEADDPQSAINGGSGIFVRTRELKR